ncbi:AbrB/MazE/SpoVT family DNA-binding domain-containing protein [Thermogemmatispora carboxidivorans]|uniref:AbrB/MazE/SpoVT family DNA-binding domain-containing protein n=1 Tax=Thermogemmatispora carboxidivorans TaxID=1382306 RepID=UPI0009DE41F8|nr:AbrB/MazE/SpoVT family DNA-binding domain-containing protein [Thermogemmatispora carboxidivorans]
MQISERQHPRVYRSKVDMSGRIVLPAEVRSRQHIHTGDQVILIEQPDGLQVKTQEQALREAQDFFATLAPLDMPLSEELIRERREEASRE